MAVAPPLRSNPNSAAVRRAHPAAIDPIPVIPAPIPVAVGPDKPNSGRPSDRAVIPGRWRTRADIVASAVACAASGENCAGQNQRPAEQFLFHLLHLLSIATRRPDPRLQG